MSEDKEPEESDDEDLEENENEKENRENNDNDSSNPYTNALTAMEWSLQAHPDYHKDYWIGNNGASSQMVGNTKDLFAKTLIQGSINAQMEHLCPSCVKGR